MSTPVDWTPPQEDLVTKLLLCILLDLKDALRESFGKSDSMSISAEIMHEAIEDLVSSGVIAEIPDDDASVSDQEKWCKDSEGSITLKIRDILSGGLGGHSNLEQEDGVS